MKESDVVKRISTPKNNQTTFGCFNYYRFDVNNWNWYEPKQFVGTSRQYECSKTITSDEVIKNIKILLC